MAQLTQRRYDNIPNINAVPLPAPIITSDPTYQSVLNMLSPKSVITTGPTSNIYSGPSSTTVDAVANSLLSLTRDRFRSNPLSGQLEYYVNGLPTLGVTGYSLTSGAPSSFGITPANTVVSQRGFSNAELTSAALNPFAATNSNSLSNMFVELYKPSANGASTNSSTYSVAQISSSKIVWNDQTGKAELMDTGSTYEGYTFAYDQGIYDLNKIDKAIALNSSASPEISKGYQAVVDYYQLDGSSKGIEAPAGSYGSKVEADGKSYVRSSGGLERLAPRTYSLGTSANGNQTVIATDTFVSNTSKGLTVQGPLNTGAFSSKTYTVPANTTGTTKWWETTGPAINYDYVPKSYSISAPSNFSYTSKVYSIR